MKEQNKDNNLTIRVNKEFKLKYKKLCESHGFTYSKRIHSIIEKDFEYLNKLNENEISL